MAEHALSGITVLDLTTGIDGPYCTKLLADLGARVIKVEPLDGDPSRRMGPFPGNIFDPDRSATFLYLNNNKECISLDLGSARGQEVVRALADQSDLVVDTFSPGTATELGLVFAELAARNSSLVHVSITPFGQTGPYARWRGPDIVRQALSGWMAQGGLPDREPLRSGGDISLFITGVYAAAAALSAVYHARGTGEGQYVDVSALEAMVTTTGQEAYRTNVGGPNAAWGRDGHRGPPATILPCRDGFVGVNLLYGSHWIDLCNLAGAADLLADPRYSTLAALREPGRGAEVAPRLAEWTMKHDALWLVQEGQRRNIAITVVPSMAELADLPPYLARDFVVEVDHPSAGHYLQPGAPYKLSETPWALQNSAHDGQVSEAIRMATTDTDGKLENRPVKDEGSTHDLSRTARMAEEQQ